MKKLGVLLSLIFLMALSGCISEKTQQKLSDSGNSGGVPQSALNYTYLNEVSVITKNENITDELQGDYYSFSVNKSSNYGVAEDTLFGSKGQYSSKKIKNNIGFPIVKISAYAENFDVDGEQMSFLKESNIEFTETPVIIGNGKIQMTSSKLEANYKGRDVVGKDNEKYTILTAYIIKTIPVENGAKNKQLTYSVSTIIKGKNAENVLLFETVLSTLKMAEQNLTEDTSTQGQIDKEGIEKFDALRNSSGADNITSKLNDIYLYIEKYYSKELGITSLTSSEDKQTKILGKAEELKQNYDNIIRKKILEVNVEWEKKLEGQLAKFETALDGVRPTSKENAEKKLVWTFSYTYKGSSLESEANKTEEIINNFVKARRDKNILNKTESSEYYIIYEEIRTSLGSFEQLFSTAVKDLVIAYTIELASDYSSLSTVNVDRQGEGKYKQFQKILKWKNALMRSKSDIYKVNQDGIAGNIAIEYINKKSINSLYQNLNETTDLDYFKLNDGDDIIKFATMKVEFAKILATQTKDAAIKMLYDYADYFNIRAGRFENRFSEKDDGDVNTLEPTKKNTHYLVYGFDGVQESFETYLYMVKMFDDKLIIGLSDSDYQEWEETLLEAEKEKVSILSDNNNLNIFLSMRYKNVISNYEKLN